MPSSSTDPAALLAALLLRLVEVLRNRRGFTWRLLRRVTAGRVGRIDLDGHRVRLEASTGEPYRLDARPDPGEDPVHFRADGVTLLAILRGRLTLDRAMEEGRVHARATLPDLLGIYQIVMSILADSPTDREIRDLCREWEASWPDLGSRVPAAAPLEEQHGDHGPLVQGIARDVLEMRPYV